ncbi:hypothetical protein F5882DRAFT_431033 [Hyaloscypha sp. PMI_1271]|nr:hypothetical protein F5882DRAFT_431033 [Hyaloscypha sp. PMI_1271]
MDSTTGAVLSNGSYARYFMKVCFSSHNKGGIHRENTNPMKAIHGLMPDFAPEPVNFGKYASDPEICFFIMKFVDMTDEIPEADSLPEKVAEMHRKGISPNGKYGFHVPELQIHGEDKEMQELFKNMVEKAIPRLLRPLETGGNNIKPRLVHGNLWDGNARSNIMTDKPIIYDASSMYAHNEFELGPWNLPRYQIFRRYIREYQRHFERSEPKEDFENRPTIAGNGGVAYIIYSRHTITSSAAYLNNLRYRETAIRDMRYLVEKYPNGYEGEHGRKGD